MISVQEFTRYRTSDGSVFDNRAVAYEHEMTRRLLHLLLEDGSQGAVERDLLVERILSNAPEIVELLGKWIKDHNCI